MAVAFLLRFEEQCVQNEAESIRCATETITKIHGEQVDADRADPEYSAVPRSTILAGTMTATRVKAEQPDPDRCLSSTNAIPTARCNLRMATTTVTNVRAETDDQDPGKRRMHIIPRCSSY